MESPRISTKAGQMKAAAVASVFRQGTPGALVDRLKETSTIGKRCRTASRTKDQAGPFYPRFLGLGWK